MTVPLYKLIRLGGCACLVCLAGCYYTVTDRDGKTRRISSREYERIQDDQPAPASGAYSTDSSIGRGVTNRRDAAEK